jgi:hypothetical protein
MVYALVFRIMGTFALQTILPQNTAGFYQKTLRAPPTKSENTVFKKNPRKSFGTATVPNPKP